MISFPGPRPEVILMRTCIFLIFSLGMLVIASNVVGGQTAPNQAQLEQMASRFAPAPLRVDTSGLSSGDRQALVKLVEAARLVNDIFMKQYWSGDVGLYQRLQKDTSPLGRARFHYFWINKGPWSDIDEYKAFLPGVPPRKLPGANFYPEDMSKEDFERWLSSLSPEEQEQAKGFFTVIRRKDSAPKAKGFLGPPEKLHDQYVIVRYSEEYKEDLTRLAGLLKEAAGLTDNPSLKKFLTTRADAFLSNDYYESDMAWMDIDAPLDITLGPYETYNDEIFGYKAAFEAYVSLRDDQESAKLSAFAKHLQEIEDNLPIDPQYRNPKLGAAAPIRVVDQIISSGDGAHGVQTAAYNLPNDERVVQQKGSKRVMLKNVQEAKFHSVLLPIAMKTLSKSAMLDVNFESFFTHILAHELMHGLGPHQIKVDGGDTNPRKELKELYSAIEEAKADVTGLFALQYMMDHSKEMGLGSVVPSDEAAQRQLYVTFLASAFRSLRFGLNDAHGKGMAVQFNYLMDKGGFVPHGDGTFSVDMTKIKDAVRDLDHDLLTLEAEGNYAGAKKMLDELGVVRPILRRVLDRLHDIPTDIEPIFVTADQLAPTVNATAGTQASTKGSPARRRKKLR
jgi:Peptidase family M49